MTGLVISPTVIGQTLCGEDVLNVVFVDDGDGKALVVFRNRADAMRKRMRTNGPGF